MTQQSAPDGLARCAWPIGKAKMIRYHDEEWGVPLHDDQKHFEFLVLDAFQAGLSWAIILNKREGFRQALAGFDPQKIARFNSRSITRLLEDEGIVRNRQKIEATISNARAFLDLQDAEGGFDSFIWRFVGGVPKQNKWRSLNRLPVKTKQSDAMSAALKERGFKFVGSTICYAYMQAAGMVNDHIVSCFRYTEVKALA